MDILPLDAGKWHMHEYAVTESILNIIEAEAAKVGARRVGEVRLVLGELSTFVDRSIEFYFNVLSRGTVAEGANLVFEKIEARATCLDCGNIFRPRHAFFACPQCNSLVFKLKQGQELYIESIDVD
jgi:hydrogenase nickel incorporation protein HypA/HybF